MRHEDLFSGNQAFGAACYGAYITTLGDMPTSRTTIAKALDLSKSAQIRYEKQLNIQQVAATIIVDKNNTYDPKSKEYKQYRSEHGQALNPVTTGNGKVIYGKRIGNIRSIERMKKKTGGRRRRKLNEKIDRVEKGQRNQSSEKNARNDHNLTIRYIKNKLGTIYHTEAVEYLKGTVKKALSFKYIRNGRFGMKRVGTYDTMPCLLFFQE